MCTVHWDYLFSSPKRRVQGPVHLQQYVYLLRTNHLCTRWWPLQEADTPTLYRLIQAGTWRAADTFTNLYCRLPVILPFSPPVQCPTYPFPSSSPSLHRIPSKPSERVRVQDLLAPFSTARPALSLTISDFYILYSTIPVSCLPACLIRFKSASLSVDPPDDPVPGVPVRASYNFLSCYGQAGVPTLLFKYSCLM